MVRRIRPGNAAADDTLILDAVERAGQEAFTREPPTTLKARINFLVKQLGTPRAAARELGVSQRSVERYRSGERKNPPREIIERIDAEVKARWQFRDRSRHRH